MTVLFAALALSSPLPAPSMHGAFIKKIDERASVSFQRPGAGDPPARVDVTNVHAHEITFVLVPPKRLPDQPANKENSVSLALADGVGAISSDGMTYRFQPGNVAFMSWGATDTRRAIKAFYELPAWSGGSASYPDARAIVHRIWWIKVDNEWVQQSSTDYPVLDFKRAGLNDASIDTRRGWGPPDAYGNANPDPNYELSNLNFGGYRWKGGLFVGNVPFYDKDQSGLARSQFYVQSNQSLDRLVFAGLTLLDMGTTAIGKNGTQLVYAECPSMAVYVRPPGDPNGSTTESNVTWATRFGVDPSDQFYDPVGGGSNGNLATFAVGGGDVNQDNKDGSQAAYMSFPITVTNADTADEPVHFTPDFNRGLVLAVFDEANVTGIRYNNATTGANENPTVAGNTSYKKWRYFASREYTGDTDLPFPHSDADPRLWMIRVEENAWYGN